MASTLPHSPLSPLRRKFPIRAILARRFWGRRVLVVSPSATLKWNPFHPNSEVSGAVSLGSVIRYLSYSIVLEPSQKNLALASPPPKARPDFWDFFFTICLGKSKLWLGGLWPPVVESP